MTCFTVDVRHLISQMKCSKAAGSDNMCAEYFKISLEKLNVLLSMCFTLIFTYYYLPSSIIETFLVLIVKNKCGNLSDSNNYRPIALVTIMFKLFESVILLKCEMFLDTCLNQFGLKSGTVQTCAFMCHNFSFIFIY